MKKVAEISVKRGWLVVDADGYIDWYQNKPRFDGRVGEWFPVSGNMGKYIPVDAPVRSSREPR